MAEIADREAAQHWDTRVLLQLIDDGEIESIGDDHWLIYDDTRPEGYRVTDQVEQLIGRGLAKPKGYHDIHLTVDGLATLAALTSLRQSTLDTTRGN